MFEKVSLVLNKYLYIFNAVTNFLVIKQSKEDMYLKIHFLRE